MTRVGDDVRIIVSLIDGSTERTIWSDQYNGTFDDVLNLQRPDCDGGRAREIDIILTPEDVARTGADIET